jgi:hypothetical protein
VQAIVSNFPVVDGDWLTIETRHKKIAGSPANQWGWSYRIRGVVPGSGTLLDGSSLSVDGDGWVTTGTTRRSFSNDQFEIDFLSIDLFA